MNQEPPRNRGRCNPRSATRSHHSALPRTPCSSNPPPTPRRSRSCRTPQLIGLLLPDRMGLVPAVIKIPRHRIQGLTPGILVPLTLTSTPRGILPLRLRRQPILFSRQGIQFLEERLDVIPTDSLDGTLRAVLEATRILSHDGFPQLWVTSYLPISKSLTCTWWTGFSSVKQ